MINYGNNLNTLKRNILNTLYLIFINKLIFIVNSSFLIFIK